MQEQLQQIKEQIKQNESAIKSNRVYIEKKKHQLDALDYPKPTE